MVGKMISLVRGANSSLPTGRIVVAVAGALPGAVDLMVFALGQSRKVRSDDDFIFFNQPRSPEGAVVLVAGDRIEIDLPGVPMAIETLAIAVALDDSVIGSLASVAGLGVRVNDAYLEAPADGLSTERAAVLIEVYRRGADWKVRNVSAGWSGGLADLVREHGVSVEDAPAAPTPDQVGLPPEPVEVRRPPAPDAAPAQLPPQKTAPAPVSKTGNISLSKGDKVSIAKTAVITATVSWPPATDYDVYALVRYVDGHTETVAQFGTREEPHYVSSTSDGAVRHLGDVRQGQASSATEVIEIRMNPNIVAVVPVVYSAQGNGAGSFFKYKVSMAIENGQGAAVQVDAAAGHKSSFVFTCVPGIIVNTPEGVAITALEQYSKRMSERRPILGKDLAVKMDAGGTNVFKQ